MPIVNASCSCIPAPTRARIKPQPPAGAGAEAEGEEAPADGQAAVPAFPKYEGLAFQPGDGLPKSVPDLAFPPTAMA